MSLPPALRDAAFRWIADDIDPAARQELQALLALAMAGDGPAAAELADRFEGTPAFGTAGLRGPVRAGPDGMNRAVVTRTTAGVAGWLGDAGAAGGTVVVGRDARHGSEDFAADAAAVLAGAGFDAAMLPGPLPTPVLAFAVRELGAVAGIQITASHNPPADNGYKFYDARGTQIVPPTDREIEAAAGRAAAAVSVPRGAPRELGGEVLESYLDRVALLARGTARKLRIALTPMHGVGGETCVRALRRAGFTDVHVVAEQAAPDADFPTVAFPNPEEPGAADLLLRLAAECGADLAIALDPDADRCALGVPDRHGWRMLSGDEAGVLLGEHVLSTVEAPDPLVATTIVSSSMLRSVATAHGARYDETLTGFKWLVRSGDGEGTGLVFAYEEAIGLCVAPDMVRDKDGIAAAVLAADLAATLRAGGRTVTGELDRLSAEHGVHLTAQIAPRFRELAGRSGRMAALRARPPASLAGVPVTAEDLLPGTDAVRFAGDGVRVVVRPSGTEPKLKAYLQVTEPPGERVAAARDRAACRLRLLRDEVSALLEG